MGTGVVGERAAWGDIRTAVGEPGHMEPLKPAVGLFMDMLKPAVGLFMDITTLVGLGIGIGALVGLGIGAAAIAIALGEARDCKGAAYVGLKVIVVAGRGLETTEMRIGDCSGMCPAATNLLTT